MPKACPYIQAILTQSHNSYHTFRLLGRAIKKGTAHAVPFLRFPIGTISKVKKDCLGLRYKGTGVVSLCQILGYV